MSTFIENEIHFNSEGTLEINNSTPQSLAEIQSQFNNCMLSQKIVIDKEQVVRNDKIINNIVQKLLNHSQTQNLKEQHVKGCFSKGGFAKVCYSRK